MSPPPQAGKDLKGTQPPSLPRSPIRYGHRFAKPSALPAALAVETGVGDAESLKHVRFFFRKKRKWDQPAEDLVSAAVKAAAVAGIPVMNFGALPGVALPGVTAYGAGTLPSVVPVPYSLPPHIAPSVPPRIAQSVLQNAAVAVQKLSQV